MKETKKVYALNSEKNSAYDEFISLAECGMGKTFISLKYKSTSYQRRKLKFKFIIKFAKYRCGDKIWNIPGSAIRDYYAEKLPILFRKHHYNRSYKNLYNKTKRGK